MNFEQIKSQLKNKKVGVAGCGGLGSNCAVALARVGVGTIVIADFDKIEESNLNRQYFFHNQIGMPKTKALKENISKINPTTKILDHEVFLDEKNIPEIFGDCDVLVEAFDKAEMKKMIIETVYKSLPEMPLVMGVGVAGWGANQIIKTETLDNIHICGDRINETSDDLPPIAPRVGIVSNMQANVVLDLLLGSNDKVKTEGNLL